MQKGTRIQKVLSANGILSRRAADRAVEEKRVTVNGRLCKPGQRINPRKDIVHIDGKRVYLEANVEKYYIMLHKPRGYITTMRDTRGRKTVAHLIEKVPARVYPVGRLDRQSEGLLLCTNDGDFANDMMHPSGEVPKTYRVTVGSNVTEEQLVELSSGMTLDDGHKTSPAIIHVLEQDDNRAVLQFVVHEGHNRLIRRMCEGVGLEVIRLKRNSVGPVKLGMLPPGEWRELTPDELRALRAAVRKQQ